MNNKKHSWYYYPLIIILIILLAFSGFVLYLSINEYKPKDIETALNGPYKSNILLNDEEFRILSFNTGYAGLGYEEDTVMDGGTRNGAEEIETVNKNMNGIENILKEANADIYMIQEIDLQASRTFNINQLDAYAETLQNYEWYYAPNYICPFVPYPIQFPIGKINSGIATYSRFKVNDATRISLPNPFKWPIRMANLKRCMLMTRFPIEDSNHELVLINFHLEAYDNGEGKALQTKQLLELIESEYNKGNYVIAGGDFNQIFPEVETYVKPTSQWVPGKLDPLPENLKDWRYVYDDTHKTCRLLNQPYDPNDPLTQLYVIDGFIVSPNLEVSNIETLDKQFEFSDHNPIIMDIKLK